MTIVDRRYSVAEGTAVKAPCRAATTANITLSGEQTIDGIAVVDGDRVLVKNQTTASENGIYTASTGNWSRARDWDGAYDVVTGTRTLINLGTVNGRSEYVVSTTGTIEPGTTSVSFFTSGQYLVDSNGTLTLTPTAGSYTPGLVINMSGTGTASSNALNSINISSDNRNGGATPANSALLIGHRFGGSALQGGRQSLAVQSVLTSASNAVNALPQYVAGSFLSQVGFDGAGTNDGGTSVAVLSATKGAVYAINAIATLKAGATYFSEATGGEINLQMETGSSAWYANVLSLVTTQEHKVHGAHYDCSLAISAISGSVGSNIGILFGPMNGAQPVPAAGTLIAVTNIDRDGLGGTITAAFTNGIDFNLATFSSWAIRTPGFTVNGAGTVDCLTLKCAGTQVLAARQTGWSGTWSGAAADKTSSFDTTTVTLPQLAARVRALEAALVYHGIVGA